MTYRRTRRDRRKFVFTGRWTVTVKDGPDAEQRAVRFLAWKMRPAAIADGLLVEEVLATWTDEKETA